MCRLHIKTCTGLDCAVLCCAGQHCIALNCTNIYLVSLCPLQHCPTAWSGQLDTTDIVLQRTVLHCTAFLPAPRSIVQKDGQDSLALWLLATDSLCPEDTVAWSATTPAAARQMFGAFSSIRTICKQSARLALLVSNALPLKVRRECV